ncbi:hypothetical protein HanXRQr2_Chr02g0048751 [Helianthus annuus]|uniref:Uncharacterized protein n=1 Tax=Helianthus annuus TaxID=4232 RepID=A0A9K3NYU1_HELAN|nr:hypothetical protein HanXRQr2_Chr02g0048751 [Helianthus annuus]KAJ0950432.1 hypothetical protein HanPSC8_Chr02g0048211 [Helianthus annuus]
MVKRCSGASPPSESEESEASSESDDYKDQAIHVSLHTEYNKI